MRKGHLWSVFPRWQEVSIILIQFRVRFLLSSISSLYRHSEVRVLLTDPGSDPKSLRSFFMHEFLSSGPDSQHIHLLSRTVGSDRIVDEISLSFRHSVEVPWLLPGVKPTNRDIKVVIIVVASFCAGRIANQNIYWNQADVLVQAGLLDPRLVPTVK